LKSDAQYTTIATNAFKVSSGTSSQTTLKAIKSELLDNFSFSHIGNQAFYYQQQLVELPLSAVRTIGDSSFDSCINLQLGPYLPYSLESLGARAFFNCAKIRLIDDDNGRALPKNLISIPENCFKYCSNIRITQFGSDDNSY